MNWTHFRRVAISLPLAILAALAMVSINEMGYRQTNQSLTNLVHTQEKRNEVVRLQEQILDAETGLRGYLLTKEEKYLKVYQTALSKLTQDSSNFQKSESLHPETLQVFSSLSKNIDSKIKEMNLRLQLFESGNEDALKFVLFSETGEEDLSNIRSISEQLIAQSSQQSLEHFDKIQNALWWSRCGITLVTFTGLFAFCMYLKQSNKLERLHKRDQALLSDERNRLEDLVRDRTASLTELATHLQEVREEERAHLARELHDELGALLTAAKLDVARLKSRIDMGNTEIVDRMQHLTETLNSGIALKRRIIEDLRPSSLSNLGLSTSLEILTSEFSQRSNIDIERNFEPVDLPESTELTIYRLVQEALTNIGKYANAKKIIVTVHNYPTYVAVQIQDDGDGFDMQKIRPSAHGLSGMRHRVEAAGGKLTINSAPSEGTTISAVIPNIKEFKSAETPATA